jgi:hypothetical protein
MSGTSPDKVSSPLGPPNMGSKGSNEKTPQSGSSRQFRACSIQKDNTQFGFEASLKDELTSRYGLVDSDIDYFENLEPRDFKEISVQDALKVRTSLVLNSRSLFETIKEARKVFYEGKSIHPWYAKQLSEAGELFQKATDTLATWSVERVQGSFMEESLEEGTGEQNTPEPKLTLEPIAPVTEPEKDEKKTSFAEKVKESENRSITTRLSWADLVEEELAEQAREDISRTRQSLVSVIRSRAGVSQENRVEIPVNLESELPVFYEKIRIAARLAGCEVVLNSQIKIELSRKDVYGSDEKARNDVLATLYTKDGKPTTELLAITDFAVLMDTLLEIPDEDSLKMTGAGKLGIYHSAVLLMRVFCEQEYSIPIAKQRNWWKGGVTLRDEMRTRLQTQVGSEGAATCILNCFDILYRKFVRYVLTKGSKDSKHRLRSIADVFSKQLFVTGGSLFTNLLRVETRTKKVEKEIPNPKGKGSKTVLVDEKYRARIRPTITDGPKTAFESTIYAKVNSALSQVETYADDYHLSSEKYSSPQEWEEEHQTWVDNLYRRVRLPSHLMVQRKQAIRAFITTRVTQNQNGQIGQAPTENSKQSKIDSATWMATQQSYITDNEEIFDNASIKAINDFLGTSHNKEGLLRLTEVGIKALLGR